MDQFLKLPNVPKTASDDTHENTGILVCFECALKMQEKDKYLLILMPGTNVAQMLIPSKS